MDLTRNKSNHIDVIKWTQALLNSLKRMDRFCANKNWRKHTEEFPLEHVELGGGTPDDRDWAKVYIEYFTRLMVLRVCHQNKVKPSNTEELIFRLTGAVSAKLEGEGFNPNPKVFKNLNRTITRVLHKTFGSIETALFYLTCEDPLIVESIIAVIRKQAMVPPKKLNSAQKLFHNLREVLNKPLPCSLLNYGLCGLKGCPHLGAPRLLPRW